MNPIEKAKFSDDFNKFVLQDQNVNPVNLQKKTPPPFKIDAPKKNDKTKKDIKKGKEEEEK